MPECSVDAIVTDPPYGLEFMGKAWDKLAGPSTATLAERLSDLPSFSSTSRRASTNPTCGSCGGRARGQKRCECDQPEWKPVGKRRNAENEGLPDDVTGSGMSAQMNGMQAFHLEWAREAFRVLKPGGHLLAFGATRTYHRMAIAIEDAGFEIRDSIHWIYGTGFPKSLDVAKAIDKAAGAEREVIGPHPYAHLNKYRTQVSTYGAVTRNVELTAPATDDAVTWDGWGTALKPAHEPIVLARKPLDGTVAANVLAHGTGALNIDAVRVGSSGGMRGTVFPKAPTVSAFGPNLNGNKKSVPTGKGRWPTNVILDDDAADALDNAAGEASHNGPARYVTGTDGSDGWGTIGRHDPGASRSGYGDRGGPSRFFSHADGNLDVGWPFLYVPKPGRKERNAGLDDLPEGDRPYGDRKAVPEGGFPDGSVNDRFTTKPAANNHPTVKPVALMRHLIRLVTPPGGTVLDPFAGSGTTLVAGVLEGVNVIGVEMTDDYLPIIAGRVSWARDQAAKNADDDQPTLFEPVDNLDADTGGTDG